MKTLIQQNSYLSAFFHGFIQAFRSVTLPLFIVISIVLQQILPGGLQPVQAQPVKVEAFPTACEISPLNLASSALELDDLYRSSAMASLSHQVFLPVITSGQDQTVVFPEGGMLNTSDGMANISVLAGSVDSPVRLAYFRAKWHHPVPLSFGDARIYFALEGTRLADGANLDRLVVIGDTKPDQESGLGNLTITVHYPAGVVEPTLESMLHLARFDENLGAWVLVTSTVDPNTHTITARTDDLGEFALLASLNAPPIPPIGAITVDDDDGGIGQFIRYPFTPPASNYWWSVTDPSSYYDGDMWYTFNTDLYPIRTNWATWTTPPLTDTGDYNVYAYIPPLNATTDHALYQITHDGGASPYLIDQYALRGNWVNLGSYPYTAGTVGEVYLDDVGTEQLPIRNEQYAFDAMTWLPPGVTWTITQTLVPYNPLWAQLGLQAWNGRGGEPVGTALGHFFTQHQDIFVPGVGLDVNFTRAYNSLDPRIGSLGLGWIYTYDIRAIDRGNGEIILVLPDGRSGLYIPDGAGGYIRPNSFFGELIKSGDQLIFTDVDQTVYVFGLDSTLQSITEPDGNELTFAYDYGGYTLTDTADREFRVNFNTKGLIDNIIDPIGRTYLYTYEGNLLKTFTNAMGGTISYTYDSEGRMDSITDPNTHTFVTNHYDSEGRVDWQKDASQNTTTFTYEDSPRRTIIVDNAGNSTTHEFDDEYRLVKETDTLGNDMVYGYDNDNNRTYIKDRGEHETFMTYDEHGNLLTHKDALSQTAEFQYDSHNNLTYALDEAGGKTFYTYDSVDNLTLITATVTLTTSVATTMTYYSNGLLKTLLDANNHPMTFTYDTDGNLKTAQDALGFVTQFDHDAVGRQTVMTDTNGHTVQFLYDDNDRITRITDPKGKTTLFAYDGVGNLCSVTDRRGHTTFYEYNENDSLIKVIDPRGNFATFTYDPMYHRKTFTNWRGFTTTYVYDAVYNLKQTIDAKLNLTSFGYDADRNLISVTDALSQTTTFDYDPLHRVVTTTNALDGVTVYGYDPVGRPLTVLDPRQGLTQYQYDLLGRLLAVTDALSNTTTLDYDPVGNLLASTNARDYTTRYAYDAVNQLLQQTDPLTHTLQLGYDGVGNVLTMTNPLDHATYFAYDANDNLFQVTDALSGTVAYTYDEEDNRLSVTDQNGHTTGFGYDELSNPLTLTLPMSQTTFFAYDENSNLSAVTNAKGNTTQYGYDELDLQISITNPLTLTTTYAYDVVRRLVQVTDANGKATHYAYDALDRLMGVTDALTQTTSYAYDPLGYLTAFTDANTNTTRFGVDLLGRVISETNPLNKTWLYAYDPVGNLVQRTDANGVLTEYTFDADNRLTHIAYPTIPGVDFSYDANDNLTGVTDNSGTTAFVYDPLDRLMTAQRLAGILAGTTLGYGYDPASNRTQITYPDGKNVNYGYNANDWLIAVTDPLTGTTHYTYDDVGLPTHMDYPNGTWADYAYDAADRLVHLFNGKPDASSNLISSFNYTLDGVGNRTRTVEQYTSGQIITWVKDYTYDDLYRLTQSVFTPDYNPAQVLTSTFDYDPVGNRLSMATNIEDEPNTPPLPDVITTTYTYNGANQMLTAGATQFAYDANGNRTSMIGPERVISYTFDIENRLIGAETFDVLPNGNWQYDSTLDYTYDGLGRRVERGVIDNGVRKTAGFLYDGLGYDLLAQYVDPGEPRTTYYYRDLTQILSRHEIQGNGAGLQYFHHYDGLGDVSAWTNHAGQATQEYTYAPYGRLMDNNGPDNSSNRTDPHNSLTWSGKLWDKETELYYFGARDYDPTTGTWLIQDLYRGHITNPMTLHRYGYVEDNPTNLIDSYGFSSDSPTQLPLDWSEPKEAGASAQLRSSSSSSIQTKVCILSDSTQNNPLKKSATGGTYSSLGEQAYILATTCGRQGISWDALDPAIRDILIRAGWDPTTYNAEFITGNAKSAQWTSHDPAVWMIGGIVVLVVTPELIAALPEITAAGGTTISAACMNDGDCTNEAISAQRGTQVITNRLQGIAYENELAEFFTQAGYKVEKGVRVVTSFGVRIYDLAIYKGNELVGYIEAKTGGSPYTTSQQAKDMQIWITQGIKVYLLRKP